MKTPTIITKIFTNKYFLYFLVFLAFTNVMGYIMVGNINAIIYFIIIALVASCFSQNMAIILFFALFLTSLMVVNKMTGKEGLENNSDEGTDDQKKKNIDTTVTTPINNNLPVVPPQIPASDESFVNKKKPRVDYAATVEDAYDNLNKIIGGDGMQKLTADTQTLMKQQLQLAEAMKTMTPLIQNITPLLSQTKEMLGGMDMSHIDNIASLAKSFTG